MKEGIVDVCSILKAIVYLVRSPLGPTLLKKSFYTILWPQDAISLIIIFFNKVGQGGLRNMAI